MFRQTRVAIAQIEPVWLDAAATLDKAIAAIGDAADQGAELVAFPEVCIPGYPWWIWHGPLSYASRFVTRYQENSIRRDGPEMVRLARAARDNRIVVVMGFSEYDRGSLYMSQATFSEHGELVSVRRKLKPTHVERAIYGDGTGADLQVHALSVGRVGALNCWEHFQPLTKYALFSMGEEIHVASWPNMSNYTDLALTFGPEVTHAINMSYAVEGQTFVLEAHNTMTQSGVDYFLHDEATRENLRVGGGISRIWGPNGESLGEPLAEDEEGLLVADLDFELIAAAKAAADPVGHYSRSDIFQLHINRTPTRHVVEYWHGDAPTTTRGEHQHNGIPTSATDNNLLAGVDLDAPDPDVSQLESETGTLTPISLANAAE
jgi:aliphatic nitrilase